MNTPLYPLLFQPVYKDYVWGGRRLARVFGRAVPGGACAESWEISGRPEGMSVARNGALLGRTLEALVDELGPALAGTRVAQPFPLLFKVLDAEQRLSVQVHPDDAGAARHGGEAKTEMWYVLQADADASIYAGLVPGVTRHAFEEALRANRVEGLLRRWPAMPGQAFFIPGGLVHAIGEGCLILEVQQSSNTTYRVYDWGRVDRDGKPRALHTEQALKAIGWDLQPELTSAPTPAGGSGNRAQGLVDCPYFRFAQLDLAAPYAIAGDARTFQVLFNAGGAVELDAAGHVETLAPGTSCLLPAGLGGGTIRPLAPPARVLHIRGPV